MSHLHDWLIFLLAALVVVPIGKRLGLSTVLGYLAAGLAIGPYGLNLAGDPAATLQFAELGVVMLLFIVGLELQPRRLLVMRRWVFGLGVAQVSSVTLALATPMHFMFAVGWPQALLLGFALSLSRTAFMLQLLGEQKKLNAPHGRAAFGVLLLQDLAVIPVIAAINLLAPRANNAAEVQAMIWGPLLFMVGVTSARLLLRPALRAIAATGIQELFTAAALVMVLGAAAATERVGLSMGLGAFLAGMLVADSEYRHQLETDIAPFKGLLLGLFFMAVGMSVDLALLLREPLLIIVLALALMLLKALVLYPIARSMALDRQSAARLAVTVSQGGEFAFVLLTAAVSTDFLDKHIAQQWILVVTLSMALTPLALALLERVFLKGRATREYDPIDVHDHAVVLLGFGRVAQIIGRVLTMRRIPFTALDASPAQIDFVRTFGNKVFYGDPTRLDLLQNAHVDKAKVVVIAVDDTAAALRIAELLRAHFPAVQLIARARNRYHELQLREIGVHHVVRETLHSSLAMTAAVLEGLGLSDVEAAHSVATFKAHDERTLDKQLAVFQDEGAYRQAARDSALELQQLFDEDAEQRLLNERRAREPGDAGA